MQLLAAEKLESVAHWLQPHLKFDQPAFDQAWTNILLADSYVWSDANSFRRPYYQRTRLGEAAHRAWAEAAYQQTSDLRLIAADKIAELIATKEQGFAVLNSENWERSDFFDVELEPDEVLLDPSTHRELPCASLQSLNGYQRVRCWAARVPSLGYRFYSIGKGHVPSGERLTLNRDAPSFENTYYKLQFDADLGRITHLIDKTTGADLVDGSSGYGLNEYLYVTGGDPGDHLPGSLKDNRLLAADITLPLPQLKINRTTMTAGPVAYRYPWGTEITVQYSALNTPEIVTTIALLDGQKQISINNELQKTATLKKEAVYFAFPFALSRPSVSYEGASAWVNPEKDMLPGSNLQWFATQGGVWANSKNTSVGWVSVDAPLVALGDINRGLWPTSIEIKNGTFFSYAMNNYWYTDTPAQQGGKFTFRYLFTSGPNISSAEAMTLSSEARSPLVAVRRYSMGWSATQPIEGRGFLTIDPPGVKVLTVRPIAARGQFLVRLHNATPTDVQATLRVSGLQLKDAFVSSPTGDKLATLDWRPDHVAVQMKGYDIQTIVLEVPRPD